MLHHLAFRDVGPAPELSISLGPRINLITGDNGLGKTFLLEAAWWALTQTWAGSPEQLREAHRRLREVLKDTDQFWPRWLFRAEQMGLEP